MDINDVRGLGSVFALAAMLSVFWWAYGSSRKQRFDKDAEIPFLEDDESPVTRGDKDRSN
ncbi:cbb3-type cytochrome oxidase subunit 3 [Parathalassolituus penaei]|uniref:Cbb3-type cytochrome c oxidase subunit 3 n=1 Tax=Parathalassolituus penaei TaxID=2997323 RepID=A0A9X3IR62_9GAMM|nr:cbb3-type cytochrome c oxidase subunit 3 [Parathalassolituus penaei]MCY0964521.1 cbb3-type cytochrome c oxidase subunit 3 [Parathalassolituus penaei]